MARITAFDICVLLIAVQASSPAFASFRLAAKCTVTAAAAYTTAVYARLKKAYQASPYTTYGASSTIDELLSRKYDACDPQFAKWARETLEANEKNGDNLGPFIFIVTPDDDCQVIFPPFLSAGRIIVLPENMEKETLEHLNSICDETCNHKLQTLTALLDHEYGHVKQKLLEERLGAIFALSFLSLPPLLGVPCALYVMTSLIRSQEQRADDNIRDDSCTLHAFQDFLKKELCSSEAKQVNPYSSLQNLLFAAEVGDGAWFSPFVAQHPPANRRIARLQERINALEANPE